MKKVAFSRRRAVPAFHSPNSIVVGVNMSIEEEVGFSPPQNVPRIIDVNHHPSKELKSKLFPTSESPSYNRCTG